MKSSCPVIVRINDRGPYARDRVIDLSCAAAAALGLPHAGVLLVKIERVEGPGAGLQHRTADVFGAVISVACSGRQLGRRVVHQAA